MTTEDELIVTALRGWAEGADRGDHPPDGELADYAASALSEEHGERIATHLTVCRACAAIVLELTRPDEGNADAEWHGVRDQLEEAGAIGTPIAPVAIHPAAAAARHGWGRQVMALVAALGGLVIGASFGIGYGRPPAIGHPVSNVQVESAQGAKRSAPAQRMKVEVRPDASRVLLLLPGRSNRAAKYRVEARNATTSVSWEPWEATPDRWGNISFEITLREHGFGMYEVRLFPIGVEDPSDLAFEIELVPQDTPE